jgi:tetratricopeptide (TPR) repeat protein
MTRQRMGFSLNVSEIGIGGPKPMPVRTTPERLVRVFISSTFRDMGAERNELVTRTFQRLRKLCDSLEIVWSEVHLRWGITDEQRVNEEVLPICLSEIEACRPYFVGILGERYGWVCESFSQELIGRYPWVRGLEGRSITDLEFQHGALRCPALSRRAFFYFRTRDSSHPLNGNPENRGDDQRPPEDNESQSSNNVQTADLERLKRQVRLSGLPLRDGYSDPKALGELVFQDLECAIREDFPETNIDHSILAARRPHETYARARTRVYLARPSDFRHLDDHVASGNMPLVITGPSGLGKSALLANWATQHRQNEPRPLLEFYVGASPESSDWRHLVAYVLGQLGVVAEVSTSDPEELRVTFARGLQRIAAVGGCILMLDALNQLEDREGALQLAWLPSVIPSKVCLILSTLEGPVLEECRRRGWSEWPVAALELSERKHLISLYLEKRYSKRLPAESSTQIAAAPSAGNPLWLIAVLEELRLHGDHETLNERIDHYIGARSVEELFALILQRWEQDYERDRPGMVRDALCMVWAARDGLSETEIRELLGTPGNPLPTLLWSIFQSAADFSMVNRSGLIGFFHSYMRSAVERRYLPTEARRHRTHLEIAAYFRGRESSPRRSRELPWQFNQGQAWEELEALLGDLEFFLSAWRSSELDVKRYWANLEQLGNRDRLTAYKAVVADPVAFQSVADGVGTLLEEAGHWRATFPIYEQLAQEFERTGERLQEARAIMRKARISDALGHRAEALAAHERAEFLFRELHDQEGLLISLGEQAQIRISQGATDLALGLLKEAERLAVELKDDNSLQAILVSRADILTDRHVLEEAEALLDRAEKICLKLGDADGLQRVYGYQIAWLIVQHRHEDALRRSEEKERICLELGDRSGQAGALSDRAVILANMNRLEDTSRLLDNAETLYRQIGSKSGLAAIAGNRASILRRSNHPEKALDLFKEQERLYNEIGERLELEVCLYNQALVHESLDEPERSIALFDRAADAAGDVGREGAQAIAWVGKARVLTNQNEYAAAYDLLKKAMGTFRKLNDLWDAAMTLRSMSEVLLRAGCVEDAMAAAKAAETLGNELRSPLDVARAIERQAEILEQAGQIQDALTTREREVTIREACGDDEGLVAALNLIVDLAHQLGETDKLLAALDAQVIPMHRLGRQAEMRTQLEETIGSIRSRGDLDPEDLNYLQGLERILSRFA